MDFNHISNSYCINDNNIGDRAALLLSTSCSWVSLDWQMIKVD